MAHQQQFIVDTKGRKRGVVLSFTSYQRLMEDLHDLAVMAERRDEEPIPLEDMKRRLRRSARARHSVAREVVLADTA